MNPGPNSLQIQIVDGPESAPNYNRDTVVRGAVIQKAIIVKRGTVGGKSTVDLLIIDQEGGQYVAMLTGALLIGLAQAIIGAEQ